MMVLLSLSLLASLAFAGEEATFLGAKKCKKCHMKVYKAWEATGHATAMKSLGDSAKAKAECVGCHTTGYKKTGGFEAVDKSADLAFVGCEACHGAGSAHVKASSETRKTTTSRPTEKVCTACHTEKWTPKFKFEEAKGKVHKVAG
jgi:hypothetical protein